MIPLISKIPIIQPEHAEQQVGLRVMAASPMNIIMVQ